MLLLRRPLPVTIAAGLLLSVTFLILALPQPNALLIAQQTKDLETTYHGNIHLRVNHISVQRNSIAVNLEVTNNSPISITLNSGLPGRGMILRDDSGNQYSLIPPENNPAVGVTSGQRLKQTFIFSGHLATTTQTLTLITNVGSGQTEISPTIVPKMVISGIAVRRI